MHRLAFAQLGIGWTIGILIVSGVVLFAGVFLLARFGALWLQSYMSNADVSMRSLVGMYLRQVDAGLVVRAKVMGRQAGLNIERIDGMSTARLEAHYLAGGDIIRVLVAVIAAQRAGIALGFDAAAAIDLAGRDVLEAVRTSVSPVIIDCPDPARSGRTSLSAIAKNGVELRAQARVTVRTNLHQLIGGATKDTIVARVGQGIITAIGSADSHMDVLEEPSRISRKVLEAGLATNTAYEVVSIDIVDIDVGENIGARLQRDQAGADMRIAQAQAEARRANALALEQEMRARTAASRASVVLAEAEIPAAMAEAFRAGKIAASVAPARDAGNTPRIAIMNDPARPDASQTG